MLLGGEEKMEASSPATGNFQHLTLTGVLCILYLRFTQRIQDATLSAGQNLLLLIIAKERFIKDNKQRR